MLETVRGVLAYVVVGGLAANFFLVFSLFTVLTGASEGSQISDSRKLSIDSDAKVFGILFGVGAFIGLFFGSSGQFALTPEFMFLPAMGSFLVGTAISYFICNKLNNDYMARAERNFAEGNFREAIEDAREVARSSETMRRRANEIVEAARAHVETPMGLGV